MEVQLQELIDKIKSEGVVVAKNDAQRIIEEAKTKAMAIVAAANDRATAAMEQVQKEEALAEQRGREAMLHAGRDLLLNLNARITSIFDTALSTHTKEAMNGETLVLMIRNILSGLNTEKAYEIGLSSDDAAMMAEQLKRSVAVTAKGGIEIKPIKSIDAGFRLSEKDGSVFYDFSSQTIASSLSAYLNPILALDLKKAAGIAP